MTNLVNLLRDMVHVQPNSGPNLTFSGARARGSNQILMNSDGVVKQDKGTAQVIYERLDNDGSLWRGAGILISQPVIDTTPYRVKTNVTQLNNLQQGGLLGSAFSYVFVGYAPEAPTGTNDLIEDCVFLPGGTQDEIISVPGLKEQDTFYERPLAIGLAVLCLEDNTRFNMHLSAQNLSKTAPQFAASMS